MELIYMNKLKNMPQIYNRNNRGLTVLQIEELEKKYNNGNPFPKAYREFLVIAGEYPNLGAHYDAPGYDWMQEEARNELEECNKTIDRPFFVIDQLDGCTQFSFIYLDETDEDPKVYHCHAHPSYWKDHGFIVERKFNPFSKLIDYCIDLAIRDYKAYYE
ncbi:MAG TPA: SMI1/KNR4 family protein [Chitinophagales bacterium]|nr:SMI1/KNR4 family protein [Chitinophagales bacterium]